MNKIEVNSDSTENQDGNNLPLKPFLDANVLWPPNCPDEMLEESIQMVIFNPTFLNIQYYSKIRLVKSETTWWIL